MYKTYIFFPTLTHLNILIVPTCDIAPEKKTLIIHMGSISQWFGILFNLVKRKNKLEMTRERENWNLCDVLDWSRVCWYSLMVFPWKAIFQNWKNFIFSVEIWWQQKLNYPTKDWDFLKILARRLWNKCWKRTHKCNNNQIQSK